MSPHPTAVPAVHPSSGPAAGPPSTDERATQQALRTAFGSFATGVSIVTCLDAHRRRVGLTVSSFGSLSLMPALVQWSLRKISPNRAAFAGASHFAVNILALDQVHLSQRFASAKDDRFAEGSWSTGLGGAPLLEGCVAVLECALESSQPAGDHLLFIGRVLATHHSDRAPLIYHAGHYRGLTEPFAPPARLPG